MFDNRHIYRSGHGKKGLTSFTVTVKETNLNIQAASDLSDAAIRSILRHRQYIETHIKSQPEFVKSLTPLPCPYPAPAIITEMSEAAGIAGVGPMAAVAGAVAEFTGRDLLDLSDEVLVENGGDIFVKSDSDMTFAVYAGESPLSMKTGIKIDRRSKPFAVCTSSGTLGHSKSFGRADAACVVASSCALADAAATALGNRVQSPDDIQAAIDEGRAMKGIEGIVVIAGKQIGLWGDLQLVKL
ncbi:MAG TPA: UPF0280 family protein [Desulfobacteraceae bacterium]|nr:UPF0280 family protein [Desulfobacteraceae bacterium]